MASLEAMAQGVVPVARSIPSVIPQLLLHASTGLQAPEDPAGDPLFWKGCHQAAMDLISRDYFESARNNFRQDLMFRLNQGLRAHYPRGFPGLSLRAGVDGTLSDLLWQNLERSHRLFQAAGTPGARMIARMIFQLRL